MAAIKVKRFIALAPVRKVATGSTDTSPIRAGLNDTGGRWPSGDISLNLTTADRDIRAAPIVRHFNIVHSRSADRSRSRSTISWAALKVTRSREPPGGTVGGRIAG